MKHQKQTILIVDDDEADRHLVELAFRAARVPGPVHCVESGEQALAYLRGEGRFANRQNFEFPAYIISDLKMALGDGFFLLNEMRKTPEWSVVPVIILSASSDENDILRAYQLGAKSYIVKPQTLPELKQIIQKFYEYWALCEVPRVNEEGFKLPTESRGKLGARFEGAPDPDP